jgi:predicted dehydrogenase
MRPSMSKNITRRSFVKSTAAFSVASPAIAKTRNPNEKLNVALIGLGGQGNFQYNGLKGENIIAMCDVDSVRAGKNFAEFDSKAKFTDYREMFDKMHKSIDAVAISTPDHSHFHPAYIAMDLDKHVYLEKPLAHSVWEVRTLTKKAQENNLVTQLGSQRHAKSNMHRVVELIQSGAIGDVSEVHSWVSSSRGMKPRLTEPQTIPNTLDYELWLGPAKNTPYDSQITPYGWRFWWDYGTGETGNWGCHILDIPYWALDLKYPTRCGASGPEAHPEMTTKSMTSWFEFPARGKQVPVKLYWHQTKAGPAILKELSLSSKGANTLFIGSKGMLITGFDQHKLLPEKDYKDFEYPDQSIPASPGFHNEFINACKGEKTPPTCNFAYTGPLTETVLLANNAFRAKEEFDWDSEKLVCKNAPKSQAFIKPTFRKGWDLGLK